MPQKHYTGDFGFKILSPYPIIKLMNQAREEFIPEFDGKDGYTAPKGVTDGSYYIIVYMDKEITHIHIPLHKPPL